MPPCFLFFFCLADLSISHPSNSFVRHEVGMAFVALLWNFDFELSDRSLDWKTANGAEHIRIIRKKRPLWVKAIPRNVPSAV